MSNEPTILEVGGATEVITVGIQGPQGPPGSNYIGGHLVTVTDLSNNDLIRFDSTIQRWVNVKQTDILNGGNF